MSNKLIKAAVVGCGHLGSYHAEKYSALKEVDLVAVCDLDKAKADKLAKKFSCKAVSDFQKLKELGVDCVSVASDTRTHFAVSSYLLENGIDVLVEKPITATLDEAQTLVDLAKSNSRILQVGHVERFNPAIVKVKDYLANPWFFEVRRIAPFKGRGADVDVVLDLMIHDIDLLLYLVGRPIVQIQAVGIPVLTGSIDIANARIEFEGGVIANISTSRAAFKSERSFRIFQPNSYISLDLEGKKIKLATKGEGNSIFGVPNVDQKEEKIDVSDALKDQIKSFVSCVINRTAPVVSGQDGLNAIKLVEEIRNAMRNSADKIGNVPDELIKAIAA